MGQRKWLIVRFLLILVTFNSGKFKLERPPASRNEGSVRAGRGPEMGSYLRPSGWGL